MTTVLERLVLSAVVLATFVAAAKTIGYLNRRIVRGRSRRRDPAAAGSPTLLYFWSTDCASCPSQERQIEEARRALEQKGRHLSLRKVNALEQTVLARSMNVMTVPTTVLLDRTGGVVAWNPGLIPAGAIVAQFERAAPPHNAS